MKKGRRKVAVTSDRGSGRGEEKGEENRKEEGKGLRWRGNRKRRVKGTMHVVLVAGGKGRGSEGRSGRRGKGEG